MQAANKENPILHNIKSGLHHQARKCDCIIYSFV